jgi:hypothetical protein
MRRSRMAPVEESSMADSFSSESETTMEPKIRRHLVRERSQLVFKGVVTAVGLY